MEKLRIFHIAPHSNEDGNGVVNVAVDLACEQARCGHDVSFFSAGGSYAPLLARHRVTHLQMDPNWLGLAGLSAAAVSLRRAVLDLSPHVVHAHFVRGALLARALRYAGKYALVTTLHNGICPSAALMGVGDVIISVSAAVAREAPRLGISAENVRVVRNASVGSPRRSAIEDVRALPDLRRPAIVTVAGLYTYKGIGDLVDAMRWLRADIPGVTLYVIGDGPERAKFEDQAAQSDGGQDIYFLGFVADPRPFLLGADVFALVSHHEAFGLAAAEAREAGCAIVGSSVDGLLEVLEHGTAGILVPPRSPRVLAETLAALLRDDVRRGQMRRQAVTNLGWLHVRRAAAETVEVYREAIAAARFRAPGGADRVSGVVTGWNPVRAPFGCFEPY